GAGQRELYERLRANPAGAFPHETPAMFSPAAAAQEEHNPTTAVKRFGPLYLPMEFTNWSHEASAHVESAYLGDWSSLTKVSVLGRQALAFLSRLGMNDLSRFELGQIKHHVQLDEHGRVASEGILVRLGDDEFLFTGPGDWMLWQLSQGEWDIEARDVSPEIFIFGVQGPRSLGVLERVLGAGSLRELAFNRSRPARLAGVDVRVLRTGISGQLGYEVHGPTGAANELWRMLRDAGTEFDLRQLGIRSQSVQHIEAGIATNGLDYIPASAVTPGAAWQFKKGGIVGSFVPASGFTDYFRTPAELGWHARGEFGHDFIGRDALLSAATSGPPTRVLAGLEWNAADVAAVLTAALHPEGPLPDPMELPRFAGPAFDTVLRDGVAVGVATGRTLSPTLRQTISLVTIAREHSAPGTEVVVVWGRPGTAQREIRAIVRALPFRPDRRRAEVDGS
ncbi:hypothetical protein, partial [Microbacterium sp.]|uniref:hypothetical protein n=1 Tax=Microbacterium sp. TaxID=51671 RepID=UPI003A858D60